MRKAVRTTIGSQRKARGHVAHRGELRGAGEHDGAHGHRLDGRVAGVPGGQPEHEAEPGRGDGDARRVEEQPAPRGAQVGVRPRRGAHRQPGRLAQEGLRAGPVADRVDGMLLRRVPGGVEEPGAAGGGALPDPPAVVAGRAASSRRAACRPGPHDPRRAPRSRRRAPPRSRWCTGSSGRRSRSPVPPLSTQGRRQVVGERGLPPAGGGYHPGAAVPGRLPTRAASGSCAALRRRRLSGRPAGPRSGGRWRPPATRPRPGRRRRARSRARAPGRPRTGRARGGDPAPRAPPRPRREVAVGEDPDRGREPAVGLDGDPRRRDGRRDVRAAVDERGDELRVDLGLDVAAHRPARPPTAAARPPGRACPGSSVWAVRLRGARTFGWPGSSENDAPRFWKWTPVSGSTTPEPNPAAFDWIRLTAFPSASTTPSQIVPPTSVRAGGGAGSARRGSIRAARSAACAPESSRATGTSRASGSVRQRVAVGEGELRRLDDEVGPRGVGPAAAGEPGARPAARSTPAR